MDRSAFQMIRCCAEMANKNTASDCIADYNQKLCESYRCLRNVLCTTPSHWYCKPTSERKEVYSCIALPSRQHSIKFISFTYPW